MNHDEEHDELWQLLGQARQPQVSPFFSRNVLRAIRKEEASAPGLLGQATDGGGAGVDAVWLAPKCLANSTRKTSVSCTWGSR